MGSLKVKLVNEFTNKKIHDHAKIRVNMCLKMTKDIE